MTSLMSMEDLFYGPAEETWILPPRDGEPLRYYREREFSPPRRYLKREPSLRPVERYASRSPVNHDLRPVVRAEPRPAPPRHEIRPIERLARVHTVPEPVPVREEIRKVEEVPVPAPVPPPTQVVVNRPAPVPPPTQVVVNRPAPVPPPTQVVVNRSAPSVPSAASAAQRSVSPPRAIIHHPIELKVPMCCEKCVKKVKDRLQDLEGVESVSTDQYNQKVTVYGRADPERVLNRVRLVKKRSAFWDMTVDYTEKYRRARHAEAEAAARESAKRKEVAKQEAQVKAMVAPANGAQVVVNLPQQSNEPKVTAILPPESGRPVPFVAEPQPHRRDFYHAPVRHDNRQLLY